MNQFKKARQISNQSESAADLKTAGVAAPKTKEKIQEVETPIMNEENNSVHVATEAINTIQSPMSDNTQPIIPKENTILSKPDIPTATIENNTDIGTQLPKAEIEAKHIPVAEPEIIQQPVEYKEISAPHTTNAKPQIVTPPQIPQPVVQPQYPESNITYVAEPIETKPAKSNKKSAPNMFTQKSESKSIRKSLVLRPSSVKIAENYCAKNGGSFNELIQILLDNFIEEYGL